MTHRFSARYLQTAGNWHFMRFFETAIFEARVPPWFSKVAVSSGIGETNKWSDSRHLQKPRFCISQFNALFCYNIFRGKGLKGTKRTKTRHAPNPNVRVRFLEFRFGFGFGSRVRVRVRFLGFGFAFGS